MSHWFTADPHFGHENIIASCGRPFPNASTMDARILAEYQARVRPSDDFWVLGDFAIAKQAGEERDRVRQIFTLIPGRKHLIVGNHDKQWVKDLPWTSVGDFREIKVDGRRVSLSHYPMITFAGARHGAMQLFGHVHHWPGTRNSVNVGVDRWNFHPVSLPEIEARAAHLPVNAHWNEVEPGCAFPTVLCVGCYATLDPALVSGHAAVRDGQIVVANTGELIAMIGNAIRGRLSEGERVCPQCIGGYLSVGEVSLAPGFLFAESLNRAVTTEG